MALAGRGAGGSAAAERGIGGCSREGYRRVQPRGVPAGAAERGTGGCSREGYQGAGGCQENTGGALALL